MLQNLLVNIAFGTRCQSKGWNLSADYPWAMVGHNCSEFIAQHQEKQLLFTMRVASET
mgnify:CR=1 FL=1